MRILKTIAIVIAPYFILMALGLFIGYLMIDVSDASLEAIGFLVVLGYYALLLPKVSYRSIDALFVTIPIYNVYFMFKIAHRLAYLPNRDWT